MSQPHSDFAASRTTLGTVYGVLLNVKAHVAALSPVMSAAPYNAPAKAPVLYIKTPNTYATPGAGVVLPAGHDAAAVGATLAVIIGRTATRLSAEKALEYVAGYAVAADLHLPHDSFYRPAIKERCRDGFLQVGTTLTKTQTPDAVTITTKINGKVAAEMSTVDVVRPVATLLADITEFMTLTPGDVVLIGAMPNQAPARAGDRVEITAPGFETISFSVEAASC